MTGSPASIFSPTPRITHAPSPEPKYPSSIVYPPTPPLDSDSDSDYMSHSSINPAPITFASPQNIPGRFAAVPPSHNLATPPLTPDDGDNHAAIGGNGARQSSKDALDFLLTLFPRNGLEALPYAKSVAITSPNMGTSFDGVVLELPGKPKALYVDGKSAQSVSLRERYHTFISSTFFVLLISMPSALWLSWIWPMNASNALLLSSLWIGHLLH